jgi:malonyl-CoA/methylmalonyl-CoA synthetase
MNLFDLLAVSARRAPEKTLLKDDPEAGPGRSWTAAALLAVAERLAAGLFAWGLRPGDRVAFLLGNRPEFILGYLAVLRLGAVMVPINLAYRRREIRHILDDAAPRLLLTEEAYRGLLAELEKEDLGGVETVVLAEELSGWERAPAGLPENLIDGADLAMILYTSGTTGKSKGAMIRHDNVLATVTGLLTAWAWEPDDALLLTLPLFHVHGLLVGMQCALAAGATVLLRRRFEAAAVLDALESGEPTLFFGVPTMYVRLVEELRRRGPANLPTLRLFCSGSAPLAPDTFEAFRDLTGHTILERYGMTETGMILSNPYAGERRPGTVGAPLPGVTVRIVEGELQVRGSNVFDGYWQAPEKTAESFVHDDAGHRWFRTGDLAARDPATGAYTLLGRRTELILSGGFNVYPREVEEVLTAFPGVREAAVAGRPHPEWGEVPAAWLVTDQEIDEAALIEYCKTQLAGFKVPRTFQYLEALPRNALGKVQKHLLP